MKGPKATSIAHKKIDSEMVKKRKADASARKEKASKKNSGAPKRPSSAFFFFMEEFRKSFKENFPDNKSVSIVGKAGGVKWKEMSESEKAPYVAKATKKKAEYEKAMEEFNSKLNGNGELKPDESGKSSSEVHDENEQEASS
ncbi:High mobility group B protein 1 [Camellia lanceoleosa]|uniref:High mobility group B protein 1 n=1 Tax=Camellia lanceoleosa TaxID=1840588 RepID=A0ACC0H6G5_9ERIC|nr:High mobility group B protein 1 [Camellia lanceoleosa]